MCLGILPLIGKENRIENFRHKPKWTGKAREGLGGKERLGKHGLICIKPPIAGQSQCHLFY